MAAEIITTEDLKLFKKELLDDLKLVLKDFNSYTEKKWLKSPEVRNLLGISHGTLQNLRLNGTLPFSKIGGAAYYDYDDIKKVMLDRKNQHRFDFLDK